MVTSRLFMPLLTELGRLGRLCYKHVAPNGALPFQGQLFNKAASFAFSSGIVRTRTLPKCNLTDLPMLDKNDASIPEQNRAKVSSLFGCRQRGSVDAGQPRTTTLDYPGSAGS